MTFQEAKDLSILKWEYIYKNKGKISGLLRALPQLSELNAQCGFCQYYLENPSQSEDRDYRTGCEECALSIKGKYIYSCLDEEHPYQKWREVSDLGPSYNEPLVTVRAEIVLNLVKNAQPKGGDKI